MCKLGVKYLVFVIKEIYVIISVSTLAFSCLLFRQKLFESWFSSEVNWQDVAPALHRPKKNKFCSTSCV